MGEVRNEIEAQWFWDDPQNVSIHENCFCQIYYLYAYCDLQVNQIIPPFIENDEGSPAVRWEKWREHFEAYLEWTNVIDHEEKFKTLKLFGGPDVRRIVSKVEVDSSHPFDNRYRVALQLLDEYFIPRVSKTYERQKFRQMAPEPNEKLDKFAIRLKKQATNCSFEDQTDSMIVDQIVSTTKDEKLKRKCLEKDHTLDEVLAMGRTHESVQLQLNTWETGINNHSIVNTVQAGAAPVKKEHRVNGTWDRTNTKHANRCTRCDGRHDSDDPNCPALSRDCKTCKKEGHFARCCPRRKKFPKHDRYEIRPTQKKKRFVREVSRDDTTENEESQVFELFHLGSRKRFVLATVGGVPVKMIIDTGADEDILSENDWKMLKSTGIEAYSIKKGSNKVFNAYGSRTPLKVLGEVNTDVSFEGRSVDSTLYVIQGGKCSLLSGDTAIKLGIVKFLSVVESDPFPCITGKKCLIN